MKTKGIRLYDSIDDVINVSLTDILDVIPNGQLYHWSILFLETSGHLGEGRSIPVFQEQIRQSTRGFIINWNDLIILSKKFNQVIDIDLIGCQDIHLLKRYENNRSMYETCDIVIQMIDGCYWEIFSKDKNLIDSFAIKFDEIELIESDYEP